MINWHEYVDQMTPQIVQIRTSKGWGTGFIHYATEGGTRCIATARHVVEEAPAKINRSTFFAVEPYIASVVEVAIWF